MRGRNRLRGLGATGGGAAYSPSLDFSDARNSMYAFLLFLW